VTKLFFVTIGKVATTEALLIIAIIDRTPTIVAKPIIVMDTMTPTIDTTRTDRLTAPTLNNGMIVKIDLFDTTGRNQYLPYTLQTLRIPTNRETRITIHNRHKLLNQILRYSRHNRYSGEVIVVTATARTGQLFGITEHGRKIVITRPTGRTPQSDMSGTIGISRIFDRIATIYRNPHIRAR
jgi:hypothetical protein